MSPKPKFKSSLRCPRNHKLPHKTPSGECTPVYCAAVTRGQSKEWRSGAEARTTSTTKKVKAEVKSLIVADEARAAAQVAEEPALAEEIEATRLMKQQHRFKMDALEIPHGLEGEEAEQFADKRLVKLLPAAIGELEWMLKFGDEKQRQDAAKQVMDSTGRGKRELAGASTPSIIINLSPGMSLPWRAGAQVVEAPVPALGTGGGENA